MSLSMQGESLKGKKRRRRNKLRPNVKISQEKASYFFFIGLLIIAIFSCVASGAPKQGFYGILFVSIGILVTLFPPVFIISKWLIIGLTLFLISLSASLLPRDFASSQSWRTNLESLGLDTGSLITPHIASTIESIIIVGVIVLIGLCSLGHRISRESFHKIAALFVIFLGCYSGISILFVSNDWIWVWNPDNQFGFFANGNHMATLMVMGSLVGVGSLSLFLKKKKWTSFLIILLATGVISWAILGYSISRAGLILFITFQVLWFALAGRKRFDYKFATSFVVLFILTVGLFLLSDTKLEDRIEGLFIEKTTNVNLINEGTKTSFSSILGLRKYIHDDTYSMINSEPWTGTGLGTFEFIFPFYQNKSTSFSEFVANSKVLHPESNWLDLASQAGLPSALISLIIILSLLIYIIFRNRKSRSWVLSLSCILSVFCILIHGIIDVPGQKFGIITSAIILIGITLKIDPRKDRASPRYSVIVYQLLAVVLFSLGVILIHSQWFSSSSIVFSDTQTRINKIQNLYNLSIDFAKTKDTVNHKKLMSSAIDLVDKAIDRTPLDSDLHFIRGKLYSMLDSDVEIIKSSFRIESTLDPTWANIPLRQSQILLFIDVKETRRLWADALARANKVSVIYSHLIWNKIIGQARQHPIQIRDVYKIATSNDDSHYIKQWMNYAGVINLNTQMPKILQNDLFSEDIKIDISSHWKRISPKDYEKYLKSNL